MRNLWKRPLCGMTHEKTDRLMMLQRALESDAMMIGLMGSDPPCPHCGQQVNAVKLASGKYDFVDPKELQALEREGLKLLGVLLLCNSKSPSRFWRKAREKHSRGAVGGTALGLCRPDG